ncbi:putative deoxyribonuclease TATDN3 isoform X2 [Coturnix japonica]|uniref:putative deoxyribonuclease TATDN3 isoform X2 n=1 Tax=Coturnix japonica TaxID=93934 RepID=UPI0013A5EA8D|nr:putative deoxyribonuclease TATDN3 isoform X2 [Coturnix japonica]
MSARLTLQCRSGESPACPGPYPDGVFHSGGGVRLPVGQAPHEGHAQRQQLVQPAPRAAPHPRVPAGGRPRRHFPPNPNRKCRPGSTTRRSPAPSLPQPGPGVGMAGPVDCHCHLSAPCFHTDVTAVVGAARQAAVAALVTVTEQAAEFRSALELSHRFPGFVLPCLGVHPVQEVSPGEQRSVTLQDLDAALPLIELHKDKLVAIGEVGLDFTPRFASTDEQKEGQRQVLTKQVELARKLDLPLNVHSRSAGRPTIHLLKEQGASKVLLHAFDGKPSVAMEGVKAGYFFSIPPSIIRSDQKLVKVLPLESICLETDSPALGPEKQVRNEPKNIYIAAEYIAKIKGIPVEEVIEVTTQNALRVFPKLRNFLQENEFEKVTGLAERFVVLLFAFYMEFKKAQLGSKKSYRLPQHLIVSVLFFPAGGYPSLCAPRLVFHGHEVPSCPECEPSFVPL